MQTLTVFFNRTVATIYETFSYW